MQARTAAQHSINAEARASGMDKALAAAELEAHDLRERLGQLEEECSRVRGTVLRGEEDARGLRERLSETARGLERALAEEARSKEEAEAIAAAHEIMRLEVEALEEALRMASLQASAAEVRHGHEIEVTMP